MWLVWWYQCLVSSCRPWLVVYRKQMTWDHCCWTHSNTTTAETRWDTQNKSDDCHVKDVLIASSSSSSSYRASLLCLPHSGSTTPSSPSTQWSSRSQSTGWWLCRRGLASVTSCPGSCSSLSSGLVPSWCLGPRLMPVTSPRSGEKTHCGRSPGHTGNNHNTLYITIRGFYSENETAAIWNR